MAYPIGTRPKIYGTNSTFHLHDRIAKSAGKELWHVKLGDFPSVGTLLSSDREVVIAQTPEQIIGLNAANGSMLWKKKGEDIGNAALAPGNTFVHLQGDGLVVRSVSDGKELHTLKVNANSIFTPRLTTNGLILIQEESEEHTMLGAYDLSLKKAWEVKLPKIEGALQTFTMKDSVALVTPEGLTCYSLDGKSRWSLPVAELGGRLPNLVAKLSEDSLLFHYNQGPSQVVSISKRGVQPLQLPDKIVGYPMVLKRPNGEYELFYQAPSRDLDENGHHTEFRLVMVDAQGHKKWEIKEQEAPRFMISDQQENVFVAFSPNLDRFVLYGGFSEKPTCYIRGFDASGKELCTFIPPEPHPILSPVSIGIKGEIYFFAGGILYAIT